MDGQVETHTGWVINHNGCQVHKRRRVQVQSPRSGDQVPTGAQPKRGQNWHNEQHYKYASFGNIGAKVPYERGQKAIITPYIRC